MGKSGVGVKPGVGDKRSEAARMGDSRYNNNTGVSNGSRLCGEQV